MDGDHQRIGVVVVHGIGEQRRLEHLDWQVRCIVSALRARPSARVTVEITGAPSATFHAEQDTWSGGASVRVVVDDPHSGTLAHIYFHEVWWADINEPYSFSKQLRFWFWCLTAWVYPGKSGSTLPTASSVRPPRVAGRTASRALTDHIWTRVRLLSVGFVAVIGAASVGMVTFLAERVLNLRAPNAIRIFVNYVAGVKLYNQQTRFGIGFPLKRQDFLDTIGEPPRVSIRRRMIRTIMEVAEGVQEGEKRLPYDRWYVLAHSLGSIVAFNGLMETAYAWPGYFTEKLWGDLCASGLAGPARPDWPLPSSDDVTSPMRPVWAKPADVAYRSRIFKNFHGMLTFGCPLEKFATIWAARVPISKEPAFRPGTIWLNVFDPIDPVSGVLRSFDGNPATCCPKPHNIGYAAGGVLLLNHLWYLNGPYDTDNLADGVAEWLVTGNPSRISANTGSRWFHPRSFRRHRRNTVAWIWWIIAVLFLTGLGALILPMVLTALAQISTTIWQQVILMF
jgi:hypothetical protein